MLTVDKFENAWTVMEKYNQKQHTYMTRIYEIRTKWVKPYFMEIFCAKMTSRQRSKSANNMLTTCMPPASPMHMFVRQYMRLQFDRKRDESYKKKKNNDCKSVSSLPCHCPLVQSGAVQRRNLAIERHASKVYT